MKGGIKKTNQTIKSNKQKNELNRKKRNKKNMQVLKDSKVKFVSAVGAHLLTSFLSVSAFLTAPGLIVLLLVGESGWEAPFQLQTRKTGFAGLTGF